MPVNLSINKTPQNGMMLSTWKVPQAVVQNSQCHRELLQTELVFDNW